MSGQNFTVESNMGELSREVAANLIASGVFAPAKKRAKSVQWESLLAREYVEKFYREDPHWYRVEVGPLPENAEVALNGKVRRYADAIVRRPDHILIIELKMMAKPEVAAQIHNYIDLFPQTPMFNKYWKEPIKGKVVCAMCDDLTKEFLARQEIEVEIYKPSNFDEWYAKRILKTG